MIYNIILWNVLTEIFQERLRSVRETSRLHSSFPRGNSHLIMLNSLPMKSKKSGSNRISCPSFPDHRSCDWNTWRCCQFLMLLLTTWHFLMHPPYHGNFWCILPSWKFRESSMIHSSMPSCPFCCAPCFKAHYCILMTACQYHWQLFQFVVQIMHNSLPVKSSEKSERIRQ